MAESKQFRLSNKAKSDLKAIAKYTEVQWNREQRNRYIKQLDDAFHLLADRPLVGQKCDYIREGYRKFPQGSHLIFFKQDSENTIVIIRVLHKSMDITSWF